MATVEFYDKKKTDTTYKNKFNTNMEYLKYMLTNYIPREEKVINKLYSGINCSDDPKLAYQDFINKKIEFNKYKPEDEKSREFKHYVISFDKEESKKLGAETIHKMCKEIIAQVPEFNNFQINIATHEDKDHIHSHIIVNSVNILDGHKFQEKGTFMRKFQHIANLYTSKKGLKTHTLPYELKYGQENRSYEKVDYLMHKRGEISNTEAFARKLEGIIKNTKNKQDLFRAMKENNLFMKWTNEDKYNNELTIGKISIKDNLTEKNYRLDTLIRKYNIDISNNTDLVDYIKKLNKINKLKNERIIGDIKLNKTDILKVNNIEEVEKLYKEVKEIINKNNKINKLYKLPLEQQQKIKDFSKKLYENSNDLQQKVKEKTEEILIKAKELNKNLNYETEKKNIENKLRDIIANKIFNNIKYDKTKDTKIGINNLINSLLNSISYVKHDNIYNNINIDYKAELQKKLETERAITY